MKRFLFSIVKSLVFSNLWISIAAVSIYASVCFLLNMSYNINELFFILFSTFSTYNILKLEGAQNENNESIFVNWVRLHKNILVLFTCIALSLAIFYFFNLTFNQQLLCLCSFFITVLYAFYLRKIWFLKIPLVAIVWTLISTCMLLLRMDWNPFINPKYSYTVLGVYCLITGLTIPFEIRDLYIDQFELSNQTLDSKIGIKHMKNLAYIHLAFAFVFFLLTTIHSLILIPLFLIAGITIYGLTRQSHELYYTLVLDGIIVLMYPLFLLYNFKCFY